MSSALTIALSRNLSSGNLHKGRGRRLTGAIICLLAATSLSGQIGTGSIVGTVSDPTGAVISDVEITVTNADSGVSRKTQSTDTGDYAVTGLQPGQYSVS